MNLANKITMVRIFLTVVVIIVLIAPLNAIGIEFPKLFVNETIVIEFKYIIAGILFLIASLTDTLDGYVARKYNMITDFGKMMDAIADKVLVNSVLIILSSQGIINPIIPIIIITRDTITNTIKMIAGNKGEVVAASNLGKLKTICLMSGMTLTLFYNLPFELINIRVADFLLLIAVVLSVVSGVQYYNMNKKYISYN